MTKTILRRHGKDQAAIPCARASVLGLTADLAERVVAAMDEQPAVRPRAVDAAPLPPGHARGSDVLAELRAADPLAPAAMRHAHDRNTWLPAGIGLRAVPLTPVLDDLDDALADVNAMLAARPDVADHVSLLMVAGPLADMLDQPDTPATDWAYLLGAVESAELTAWSRLTGATLAEVAL